ncbi:type II toxin-antitoxin system SpoIISA family toxin [Lysinibacillus sp. UGB7]|uniref:type II toxin-antitoxin system SpoIISA family toxin n=1 Tax=Lysinibacillus sp. UGB7 TaxID=3411039 RepID=UPI003B7DA068
MAEKKKGKMKVKVLCWDINFEWVFLSVVIISAIAVSVLLYKFNIPYMNILFGGFALLLLVVLAYYWMNSKGYYNNLGRIRRTFYTMYFLFMIYGFISEEIDFTKWEILLQLSGLVVFVDLAVFQNPNILKIWNTELKHDDEIREALNESKDVILKNAKKVEKFTQVIQQTDVYFDNKPVPTSMNEYREGATGYLELYSNVMDFTTSFFMFESPVTIEDKEQSIKQQIRDISIRHAIEFEDKVAMQKSFSEGETLILREGKLIAIPYFGDFYCMIVTIESKPELVDGIDASHILSMLVIFDWYMTDIATLEVEEEEEVAHIPTDEPLSSNTGGNSETS